MRHTENLNLPLFDGTDKLRVTPTSNSINSAMTIIDTELSDLKEDLNDLKEQMGSGGTVNVSEGLKTILQRIQFEIKACIRDDSVCPNSYIDTTDSLINSIGTGSDTPSQPSDPTDTSLSVSYVGTIATVNNLKNINVSYSGTIAEIGA